MRYHQNSETRTCNVARVRCLQGVAQSPNGRPSFRNSQARSRIQKTVCSQSEQARTKAETKARRFPRPCRLAGCRPFLLAASNQRVISKALADDSRKQQFEAVIIVP